MSATAENKTVKNVPVPPEKPEAVPESFSKKVKDLFMGTPKKNFGDVNVVNGEVKKETVSPFTEPQTEKLFTVKDLTTNLTPKKIMKLFGILLMVVFIFAALYVRFIRKAPVRNTPTIVTAPTPTYSPFQKYKPSIYADDPNFKKIDEGISVLENEVKSTPLEDKTLLPPSLDFAVTFD